MRRLFGTDGIRGTAGAFPLDRQTTYAIGRALGDHVKGTRRPRVVMGQDTRESSGWIGDSVAAGLEKAGVDVFSAGVVTTPCIAYLTIAQGFEAGVVISASHNPWQDNGIKVFGGNGYKLPDSIEIDIERELFEILEMGEDTAAIAPSIPSLPGDAALRRAYETWLAATIGTKGLDQVNVVVDCANGAASAVAPELFRMCGVTKVQFTHTSPNGRNINERCGALHPEVVAREVVERKADLGVCFDGDADRALFADDKGNVVNGDAVLLLAARELAEAKLLPGNMIVATTMSNMGLEAALRKSGIGMLRAPVGDKYVLEEMKKHGYALGGEQSGHIIFARTSTTGDGLLTALRVLEIMARSGKSLAELTSDLQVFPQVIKNVRVRERKPFQDIPSVAAAIKHAETELSQEGRVVVRYSGTEALCRVMVEAASREMMDKHANSIAGAIQKEIGV